MNRYYSYINNSIKIIEAYKADIPFAVFIKLFFAKEKKFGSRDRKQIASLCYNYFRVGSIINKILNEDLILAAEFLCNENSAIIIALKPEWKEMLNQPIIDKIKFINPQLTISDLFPLKNELNTQINLEVFCKSILIQPDVFVRIRPEQFEQTTQKIKQSVLPKTFISNDCVQFAAGSKIENFIEPDKEVVIQDLNSQRVLDYIINNQKEFSDNINIWDCCAASGGKSILLNDILKVKFKLTVSDIRSSIMANLHVRFKKAGIKKYDHFITDSSSPNFKSGNELYDIIICDAPCTGSGTWSRTPEQLHFFNPTTIDEFVKLQKKICSNVVSKLKKGGLFFYITCSVFKKENEAQATFIQQELNLELLESKTLHGYESKADSMFTAVFKK